MYKVNINIDKAKDLAYVDPGSDFYDDLTTTEWDYFGYEDKEPIRESIFNQISNLSYNHYGKFETQTEVEFIFLY